MERIPHSSCVLAGIIVWCDDLAVAGESFHDHVVESNGLWKCLVEIIVVGGVDAGRSSRTTPSKAKFGIIRQADNLAVFDGNSSVPNTVSDADLVVREEGVLDYE